MSTKYTPEGWPDHIGKHGRLIDPPDKSIRRYTIIDEIRKQTSTNLSKVIYLQLIEFDDGKQELRLCYYIKGKQGKAIGKWIFGQYATFISSPDFQSIISEAKARSWI